MIPLEPRFATRQFSIGDVLIGGGAPISVQSMTKCPTEDEALVLKEIEALVEIRPENLEEREQETLKAMGWWALAQKLAPFKCDIIRVSVNNKGGADTIASIVKNSPIPVVADIHFNTVFALAAIEGKVHKLRLNPGNIRDPKLKKSIIEGCRDNQIPMRIGVNAGSIDPKKLEEHGGDALSAMADSVLTEAAFCESLGYNDIAYSVKTHRADTTIRAYQLVAEKSNYPAHVGVTEAGVGVSAAINSLVGIGLLLKKGIGDTIRVSLTESSAIEVIVGRLILETLNLSGIDYRPVWGDSLNREHPNRQEISFEV